MSDVSSGNVLQRLIYFSTFSPTFPTTRAEQDEVVANIVQVSILKNGKLGLTGLLLVHQNRFVQVLEGSSEKLMTVYGAICSDTRHVDLTLLGVNPISKRDFYNWDMCSRRLSKSEDGLLKVLDVNGTFSPETLNFENALELLLAVRAMPSRPEAA